MSAQPPELPPLNPKIKQKQGKPILLGLGIGCSVLLVGVLGFAALVALFMLSAKDIKFSENQKACVVTAKAISEYTSIPLDPIFETYKAEQYFDTSKDFNYVYINETAGIYIDHTITIEPSAADTQVSYTMTWAGVGIGSQFGGAAMEERNELFTWGDASKYAIQKYDGDEIGFAFITKKGNKIFFLMVAGVGFDSQNDINSLLTKYLEKFEKEAF